MFLWKDCDRRHAYCYQVRTGLPAPTLGSLCLPQSAGLRAWDRGSSGLSDSAAARIHQPLPAGVTSCPSTIPQSFSMTSSTVRAPRAGASRHVEVPRQSCATFAGATFLPQLKNAHACYKLRTMLATNRRWPLQACLPTDRRAPHRG
jgi:hypothetical protein